MAVNNSFRTGILVCLLADSFHVRRQIFGCGANSADYGIQDGRYGIVIVFRTDYHHGKHSKVGFHTEFDRMCNTFCYWLDSISFGMGEARFQYIISRWKSKNNRNIISKYNRRNKYNQWRK